MRNGILSSLVMSLLAMFSVLHAAQNDQDLAALHAKAEQGDATAQNSLGGRYNRGAGLPKDVNEARQWWRRAAEQGHGVAQQNLCKSFVDPLDILKEIIPPGNFPPAPVGLSKQEMNEAINWCGKAANQGFAESQTNAGLLHGRGSPDVKPDYEQAYFWLARNPSVAAFHVHIGKQLTQAKRTELDQRAKNFVPVRTPPAPPRE